MKTNGLTHAIVTSITETGKNLVAHAAISANCTCVIPRFNRKFFIACPISMFMINPWFFFYCFVFAK